MCDHADFTAQVVVNRLEGVRFVAEIHINCSQCGTPFVFFGLPAGLDIDGAAVSADGTEARLSIGPQGTPLKKYSGPKGFTIKDKRGAQHG